MNLSHYQTLVDALKDAPAARPFVTMWKGEGDVETATFGEFRNMAKVQAAHFQAHGLEPGDRVIIIMPQGIPLMASFAGAMMAGAVPAILAYPNFKLEPAKYRYGLAGVTSNLSARLIVLDADFPDDLRDYVHGSPGTGVLKSAQPADGAAPVMDAFKAAPDDLAFIQHSAGTTGLQKGVALTHAGVLTQLQRLVPALRLTAEDCVYSWLPLYHDMGLIACFMLPMVCHLHLVMQSPTDWVMQPGAMLELITGYRCTAAWIPNFAYQFLARRFPPSRRSGLDLSSLRLLINCSEQVRAESMDEFARAYAEYGLRPEALQSSYAMAENVFAVTQSGIGEFAGPHRVAIDGELFRIEHRAVLVDAGQPGAMTMVSSGCCLPGNEVRIVDKSGQELPPDSAGEILIRSDSLLQGYFNRPDLTAKALRDGWYHSGDLGFRVGQELFVAGRKNDLIIAAGKNIYPQDVEEITCSHTTVHDGRAIALGLFNPDLGTEEIVVVAEVHHEKDLEAALGIEAEIRNAIVAELGVGVRRVILKPPRWIVKSSAGKAARSSTREKLLKEHPELQQGNALRNAPGSMA